MKKQFMIMVFTILVPYSFFANTSISNGCVKIGLIGEFNKYNGKATQYFGDEIKNGVEVAISYFVKEKKCFTPIVIDISKTIANIPGLIQLYSSLGVKYFIGLGISTQARMAIDVLKKTNSILVSPTASSQDLIERGSINSRLILLYPTNERIIDEIISYVKLNNITKIVMISQERDIYSQNMAHLFYDKFKAIGGNIVKHIEINPLKVDVKKHYLDLKTIEYTHYFIPLYELEVANVISQIKEMKLDKKYIGTDSWGTWSQVIKNIISYSEMDVFVPQIYNSKNPSRLNQYLVENYRKSYNKMPTDLSGFSFEAVFLIDLIINRCDLLKQSIDTCLKKINSFYGVSGDISYDKNLTFKRDFKITKWE